MRWRSCWILVGVVAVHAAACGEKVDCKKLCEKEAACVEQIHVLLGRAASDQFARLSDDDRKAWADRQRDQCLPDCNSPTKPGSTHTKWKECLKYEDCEEFARCAFR